MTPNIINWANFSARMARQQNKNGFTLIEVMVSIALIAILGVGAVLIFTTATTTISKAKAKNEQQLLVDGVIELLSSELRYATNVTLTDNTAGAATFVSVQNNTLYLNGAAVFETSTSSSASVAQNYGVQFTYKDENTITITVTASDDYGNTTTESASVKLLNLALLDSQTLTAADTDASYSAVTYTPSVASTG